ncbi:N-(5'-phosphoribosyl)anthranilate isomerase [Paenibacillus glycanilyticus]|uniref:N-(5'-phosphoribosyl)anthranilate isomerase n=1 Tax=Paenibacillus glycanilyticus TaxID=126569 RepID=A0ABQ6NNS5_9BACL|nr:phosphoribosylanthranilate isomerase [Paenibacillus glycanilyticus]GMK46208.1 N-(5'-phosphoribosyl)anthranilate isomerase [Paenibacillus glycanilyticus]
MTASPRIKICGLRDSATIAEMNGLPFHEIGFVFAPSKRQVDAETAAALIQTAKQLQAADGVAPQTVGVFVNPGMEELTAIVAKAPLNVVQLHGQETPEFCRLVKNRLDKKIWKVFSIGKDGADAHDRVSSYGGAVDAILIDTAGGGTGQTFDWQLITDYQNAAAAIGVPLYVAGGLHPGNVEELLAGHPVDGIDVSSGVETDGRKDIEKIRLFVGKVIER